MSVDVSARRLSEMIELVMTGCDPSIVVAAVEAGGGWPLDRHRRLIAATAGIFDQKEMEVKAAQVVTKKVMLHPLAPTTRKRDTAQPPNTFRLLQARPEHADYDEALEMLEIKKTTKTTTMISATLKSCQKL